MAIVVPEPPGPSARTANMRANRRRDTSLETDVRSRLHARGLRFRVDFPIKLEGRRAVRPDIVFPRVRVCVELDGCWWHGCEICGQRQARVNANYWTPKIARNKERDAEQTASLAAAGWRVLRFWGHEDPVAITDAIAAVVAGERANKSTPG